MQNSDCCRSPSIGINVPDNRRKISDSSIASLYMQTWLEVYIYQLDSGQYKDREDLSNWTREHI